MSDTEEIARLSRMVEELEAERDALIVKCDDLKQKNAGLVRSIKTQIDVNHNRALDFIRQADAAEAVMNWHIDEDGDRDTYRKWFIEALKRTVKEISEEAEAQ